jgi:hypothetical protein
MCLPLSKLLDEIVGESTTQDEPIVPVLRTPNRKARTEIAVRQALWTMVDNKETFIFKISSGQQFKV